MKTLPSLSLFERAIALLSPSAALKRYRARAALTAISSYSVSRTAGSYKGTMSNWHTYRQDRANEGQERELIATRAQDMVANDSHAASVIEGMNINVVGTGIHPQSRPNAKVLGWTEKQAREFQAQAEWVWSLWANGKECDARGRLPFWAMQFQSVWSLLVNGEFFRIPIMIDEPGRTFSLALQSITPLRCCTPSDLIHDKNIRDGIKLGKYGQPDGYYIFSPPEELQDDWASVAYTSQPSMYFKYIPARLGHRPGMFHVFIAKEDEQVRGVSVLAPAMKFFRDLSDYLDYELVGAIVAASFPVFIETNNPIETAQYYQSEDEADEKTYYGEVAPGQIMYGNPGEKPHILEANRPGNTFDSFVERILRAVGAAVGMPYEIVAKDFSKTNYSSARAALLEAWRVFRVYQKWLVDMFCQPVWEMVLEEAWLRGLITLPKGSPDWYDAMPAYTRATWIPPRRGHVDPIKEMRANTDGLKNNILTLADIVAENGGDWETVLEQKARERQKMQELGLLEDSNNEQNTKTV